MFFSLNNKKSSRKNQVRKNLNQQFDFCSLEPRQLLAISFSGGDLIFYGTGGNDSAMVSLDNPSTIRAELNGSSQTFASSAVDEIYFYGYGGSDQFENQTSISVTAYGGSGVDQLTGGNGVDFIRGGDGDDVIVGNGGGDNLGGNSGDDVIVGGAGADSIYGGDGNDNLLGNNEVDFVSGGNGADTISGGPGNDTLTGEAGVDTIHGDDGNDTIYGGFLSDILFGDDGNDRVFGFAGNDSLTGGNGHDLLIGGIGNDTVEGNAGNDLLAGNPGNDTLSGSSGTDTVYGGDGDDDLSGGADNDSVQGSNGDDTLDGGDGDDIVSGNAGDDTLRGGNGNDNIYGGDGVDELFGDGGADNLYGVNGNDLLFGGSGNDRLDGGNDNDRLYGEAGNDLLFGRGGNDGLFGGIGGSDQIRGDAGSDRFLIWSGDTMVDRGELEAQVEFKNETSNWNEAEIQVIDEGLHWLQEQAGTSLVVRDSLDTDPVIYSKWSFLDGAVGVNYLTTYFNSQTGYTYDREIQFLDWNENSDYYNFETIRTTVHEVGHSWGSVEEINNVLSGYGSLWTDFLNASSWRDTNPNSFLYNQSYDGDWWYHENAVFAYDYGRTNPHEDWSTVFEAAYDASILNSNVPGLSTKLAIFDELMAAFNDA